MLQNESLADAQVQQVAAAAGAVVPLAVLPAAPPLPLSTALSEQQHVSDPVTPSAKHVLIRPLKSRTAVPQHMSIRSFNACPLSAVVPPNPCRPYLSRTWGILSPRAPTVVSSTRVDPITRSVSFCQFFPNPCPPPTSRTTRVSPAGAAPEVGVRQALCVRPQGAYTRPHSPCGKCRLPHITIITQD